MAQRNSLQIWQPYWTKYAKVLHNNIKGIIIDIKGVTILSLQAHTDLESHLIDASSTSETVQFIRLLQHLKRELKSWEGQLQVYHSGQNILERNYYQFPSNWLDVDEVNGKWNAFNDILKRKDMAMQSQVHSKILV